MGTLVNVTGKNFTTSAGGGPQVVLTKQGGGTINAPVSSFNATMIGFVVPDGAASGPFTVTVGAQSATSSASLAITPASSFSLVVLPGTGSVIQGQSTTFAVTLSSANGFSELATLSVSGLPTGVTASLSPLQITAGQTTLLTVIAPAAQATGSATLTVSASATVQGIAATQSATATLNVQAVSTSFVGRTVVQDPTQTPLAGVTVTFMGVNGSGQSTGCTGTTRSDAGGNFAITNLVANCVGQQLIRYDGLTATSPPGQYAGVDLLYSFVAGQVTNPPVLIHLPRIDNAETKMVKQNAAADQTFTFSSIPLLSVTVYAGTTFTLADGTQPDPFPLTAIQVPMDRLPDVMPQSSTMIMAFIVAFQPANTVASQPVAVTFPNTLSTAPATQMDLNTLDPTKGIMVKYGTGTVSNDATQIVPDMDPAHLGHRFGLVHFDWHGPFASAVRPSRNLADPSPDECGPQTASPVDLSSGIEVIRVTDLAFNGGRGTIAIVRTYRGLSGNLGAFGLGGSHNYDFRVNFAGFIGGSSAFPSTLVMPDGNQFTLSPQSNGTFANTSIPAVRGAVLTPTSNSSGDLRWKDGTTYHFTGIACIQGGACTAFLSGITDPNGNTISLTRNPSLPFQLTQITDPVGRSLTLTYDNSSFATSNRITSIVDPIGRQVRYSYNILGALTSVTDPAGGVTSYEYDPLNRLTKITDPRGVVVVQNTYEFHDRVVQQVQADGGVTKISYSLTTTGTSLLTTVTDPLGNTTTYHFNPLGFLLDATDATGQMRIFTRDPGTNLLLSIKGTAACQVCGASSAGDVSFTYDANGNVLTQTDALGNTTTFTYEPTFNKVTSITDALGNVTRFTYDANGNLSSRTDGNGNKSTFAYNSVGQLTQATNPLNQRLAFSFDSFGNLAGATDALGKTFTIGYDAVSRPTQITDPLGNTAQFVYDNLDRIVVNTNAQGKQIQFAYDALGNLLSLTDTRGNKTSFIYDAMNRLLTRTNALGKSDMRTYDFNGKLISFVDRRGQTSKFTYDALNRLIRETYQDGSTVARSYDATSHLVHVVDSVGGTFDFSYDLVGRLTSSAGQFGTVQFSRDAVHRVASRQVVGQQTVQYSYDGVGNLLKAAMPQASVTFTYDAVNRLSSVSRSNGVSSQYAYNADGKLLTLTHSSGSIVLNSLTYTYDARGRRSSAMSTIAESLTTSAATSSYDAANQLAQSGPSSYSFDGNGNLTSVNNSSGTTSLAWDSRNRLQSITAPNGQKTTLLYDFRRNLSAQTDSGPALNLTQNFVLDDRTNIAYINRSNGDSLSILSGRRIDQHVAAVHSSGQVEYGLPDALNSTTATVDATGAMKAKFFYEPYGQTTASDGSYPFQFTGRVPVGGFYYLRARYYDPIAGRFISEDPAGFRAGDANLFRYVFNRPTNNLDPHGLGLGSSLPPELSFCSEEVTEAEAVDFIEEITEELSELALKLRQLDLREIEREVTERIRLPRAGGTLLDLLAGEYELFIPLFVPPIPPSLRNPPGAACPGSCLQ